MDVTQPPRSLAEVRQHLAQGTYTLPQLVQFYLERVQARPQLNAFLEVWPDEALARAQAIQEKMQNGTAGRLAGMVLGVKDNICLQGHTATGGSKILAGFKSLFTATALQRLLDEDALVLGRTNCDEFAMGSSNENSAYGPVLNPLDETRVPGGSSGGSAAAVAAGLCLAALGSDTGGSVRQPAAFCGLVGFKPTYGRISRYGLMAYGSSFDQIGPLTHTLDDAALLGHIMAGHDPHDNTSSTQPLEDWAVQAPGRPLRIGVLAEAFDAPGMHLHVREGLGRLVNALTDAGHTVERATFPLLQYLVPTYYILTTAEASSNLARYDGVRYGYRAEGATSLEDMYIRTRTEGFGTEVKRRIMLGTFVLSSGYYDAYYTKAMRVRRLIRDATRELLTHYDVLLTPASPIPAFPLGERMTDPLQMYLADIFTVHANLAGMPAVSVPGGTTPEGLPLGYHLLAGEFQEARLFSAAGALMTLGAQ